jgi:serine/threonine protein kinase
MMFRQRQATIFALADRPDVLLKYEINCDSVHGIHPLVREALMLNLLKDLDITPRFLYLSGPLKFSLPLRIKTEVTLSDAALEKCANHKRSSVRVIAMENAGPSVNDYVGKGAFGENGFPLHDALRITLDLLSIIEVLHSRGIVHGDVHPGNVVIKEDTGKVKVIDFGRAFFSLDFEDKPVRIRAPFSSMHCLFSHWNIEGDRFGFRDDLFKALHVLAVLLMGRPFNEHCIALQDDLNPFRLFLFKSARNYFQIPGLRDPVEEARYLDSDIRQLVKIHLNRAMDIARDQPDVNAPARIAEVRDQLQAALHLVSPPNSIIN